MGEQLYNRTLKAYINFVNIFIVKNINVFLYMYMFQAEELGNIVANAIIMLPGRGRGGGRGGGRGRRRNTYIFYN